MISRSRPAALGIVVGLSLGLAACGKPNETSNATSPPAGTVPEGGPAATSTAAAVKAPTLADGPDVCFRAIAKHLGANTKVSEITSFFSAGSEIDSSDTEPKGEMTTCTVQYQSPSDARKLVETSWNRRTGAFDAPNPVEITVAGGDAAKFRLDDYLIPLSQLNPAALTAVMDAQKAKLDGVYSRYAWSGVRLSGPDAFSPTHTLRLDLSGRLASNDIKGGGYAKVSTDGKTVKINYLLP